MKHETMSSQSEAETAEMADPASTAEMADPASTAEAAEMADPISTAGAAGDTANETVASDSPTAAEPADSSEAASPPDEDGAQTGQLGQVPSFLREIARAMQAAVDRERGRISTETTSSLDAHVQKVRTRASTEAADLKRLAKQDVDEIRAWSAAEAERLRLETESRIGARREDLGRHLRQHETLVGREIAGATEAFAEYRAELDRFVDRVAGEREPSEIARLAELLPEPPRVEDIAAAARAHAFAQLQRSDGDEGDTPGPDVIGVMDPGAMAPDLSAAPRSDDEPVTPAPPRRLRSRSIVDLNIPLGLVVILAVLAVVMIVVLTGQARAG
jgi:F0F1-type ATP synthase membrane subunit b/b'